MGQRVCPSCGKLQQQPHRVRCKHCGVVSHRGLEVCPACGELLRRDWLWPVWVGVGTVLVLLVVAIAVWAVRFGWQRFQPAVAVSTAQAVAEEVPVLVKVPTLTPSLTPSSTPTPSITPSPTLTPSLTPTPTSTPTPTLTPTETPTPTPTSTATKARPSATPTIPTDTPTPLPTLAPPEPEEPEDGAPYSGSDTFIRLGWRSGHTLKPDEYFEVRVRYTNSGSPVVLPVQVQETFWWVDKALYLQADQETERIYRWSVRLVRKVTTDGGEEEYEAISPASEEWSFYWKP